MKFIKSLASFIAKTFIDFSTVITSWEGVKSVYRVSLYRNAAYLILSTAVLALLGFTFWAIVARYYSPEDVGLASAAISAICLLGVFANIGLGYGLIRFLPQSDDDVSNMINLCLSIGGLASIVVASIFLSGLTFWSPSLLFITDNVVYITIFVLFTLIHTLSILTDDAFVAKRRAGFILARNLIFNLLKLPLPILLSAFFHSFGIFSSWGISLAVAFLVSFFLFLPQAQPGYRPFFGFKSKALKKLLQFSFVNYLSVLLWSAPAYLLPLIIVNLLGAEANAYFYIAWSVGGMLFVIPSSVSTSLFAEGSSEVERLGLNIWRSLRMILIIIVPAIVLALIFADKLLLLIGPSYSENGTTLLRLLAISTFPLAINVVYLSVKRVEKKPKVIIGLTLIMALLTLGLSFLLLPRLQINGVGVAWIISQSIIALIVGIDWFFKRLLTR